MEKIWYNDYIVVIIPAHKAVSAEPQKSAAHLPEPHGAVRPWYNGLQNRLSNAGKVADICHSPCLRGTGHRTGCLLVVYTLIRYGMFVFGAKAPKK